VFLFLTPPKTKIAAEECMNVYAILSRPVKRGTKRSERVPLEPDALREIAQSSGVQLLDILACKGTFESVLICRAPDSPTLACLLDALEGWHTEALLVTSHVRYESRPETHPGSGRLQ
jgi:uncharacterized protein with GYD domain